MSARERARPWQVLLGRVGYAARATIYVLIACFALEAAVRWDPHETRGLGGAWRTLVGEPGGRWLLGTLALGLLAHAAWRAVQALTDVDGVGRGLRGVAIRTGDGLVGAFYLGLFAYALVLLVTGGHAGGDGAKRSAMSDVLTHPFGRVVAAGVGVGLLVFGIVELFAAWRGSFLRDLDRRHLGPGGDLALSVVGRVGVAVRGLLFGVAGALLFRSAVRARADTVSSGDVLRRVAESAFGIPTVALLALGLLAYAALMLAEACWRRMAGGGR